MSDEGWTIDDIVRRTGLSLPNVESRIRRSGLTATHREPGRHGKNVYRPQDVRNAWTAKGWTGLEKSRAGQPVDPQLGGVA